MNAKGVTLQAALAAVSLVAAYNIWQRAPEGAPGEVEVVPATSRSLSLVRFEDEQHWVGLKKEGDAYWVELGSKQPKPGVTPATVPPPRLLKGNDTAAKSFERFTPLRASRALGVLDEKKLTELGLSGSPRRLTLTVSGSPQVFTLSQQQGGITSPYLRRDSDSRVFLLGANVLTDLEAAASRLADRRLHSFAPQDFDGITVTQAKSAHRYTVKGQAPEAVTFFAEGASAQPDEFAKNWHDKVWRLVPVELYGQGEVLEAGPLETVFQVSYRKGEKPLGELTVARSAKGEFFARSEHTAGWTRLHGGVEPLATEAVRVAGGK